jgi:D-galactarolactone cycloisomerase
LPFPFDIRITAVNVHILRARLKRRFGWSLNWTETRTASLVEVSTDVGITGWGDGWWGGDLLIRHPEKVIGRSPFEVEGIYDDLRAEAGHQTRAGDVSAGGLDLALWDVCGQALGKPVSQLLGKRYRDQAEPYLTALYAQDWPDLAEGLAEEAVAWKEGGWRRMKMKIGYGPEVDVRIVRAVRNAVGDDVELGVDSNCAYDAGTAIGLGSRLEPFGLMWWEEPLLANDLAGYDRLAGSLRIPLASGETLGADQAIKDYIQPRRVDILQPDLDTVGFTGGRRLGYLCWLNSIRLIPHNWGTALRTVATLHWLATMPPLTPAAKDFTLFELDQTESPFRDAVLENPPKRNQFGRMEVPQGPGLGVQIRREAVDEFRERLIEIR